MLCLRDGGGGGRKRESVEREREHNVVLREREIVTYFMSAGERGEGGGGHWCMFLEFSFVLCYLPVTVVFVLFLTQENKMTWVLSLTQENKMTRVLSLAQENKMTRFCSFSTLTLTLILLIFSVV